MTLALLPRTDLMSDSAYERHLESLDAEEDAFRLCDAALAKERRIYALWDLEGDELRRAVARAWVGR